MASALREFERLWKTGNSRVVHGNHYAISKTREPGVGAARRLVAA